MRVDRSQFHIEATLNDTRNGVVDCLALEMGAMVCTEKSVTTNLHYVTSQKSKDLNYVRRAGLISCAMSAY
jgi:hypothetical protein